MTYRGHIKGGMVVLDQPANLPDGTKVEVVQLPAENSEQVPEDVLRLREALLAFAGCIDDPNLPTDLARNHDHYLHGAPKK
jgi:hypothetical protein